MFSFYPFFTLLLLMCLYDNKNNVVTRSYRTVTFILYTDTTKHRLSTGKVLLRASWFSSSGIPVFILELSCVNAQCRLDAYPGILLLQR